MTNPKFAVVGHPNKGKSSIVSTLTRQDAVAISAVSGTTTESQAFPLRINGEVLYELIDTPGFQRPRQVLQWLEQKNVDASMRKQAISQFVETFRNDPEQTFHDEVELLSPVLKGSGLIYVVDGSLPYTPEYEAEMSILQWSSAPSMALINPIGGEDYIEQWRDALSQYFSVVRVFDPMTADLEKQKQILSAFAELQESWREALLDGVKRLERHHVELMNQSARLVADYINDVLQIVEEIPVPAAFAEASLKSVLQARYQQSLRDAEAHLHQQFQRLFSHQRLDWSWDELAADFPDLFDQSTWFMFGLNRTKIVSLSASAGAAAGAAIDVGLGGSSLMLGAFAGGVLTGAVSLAATWKNDNLNIKGVPIAGKTLTAGPVKDINFAFILLGRAIDFLTMIERRTHANRTVSDVNRTRLADRIQVLSNTDQIKMTRTLMRAHKGLNEKDLLQLKDWVLVLSA